MGQKERQNAPQLPLGGKFQCIISKLARMEYETESEKKIETLTKLFNRFYQPKTIKTQAKKNILKRTDKHGNTGLWLGRSIRLRNPKLQRWVAIIKNDKINNRQEKTRQNIDWKKSMYKVQWIFFKGTTFKGTFSKNEEEHNTRCTTYKQREENQRGTNKKILRKKSKGIWNFWSNN